jgi:hypothetical protein
MEGTAKTSVGSNKCTELENMGQGTVLRVILATKPTSSRGLYGGTPRNRVQWCLEDRGRSEPGDTNMEVSLILVTTGMLGQEGLSKVNVT